MAATVGLFYGKDDKGIYAHRLAGDHPRKVYVQGKVQSTLVAFPDGKEVWVYWHESSGVERETAINLTRQAWESGKLAGTGTT